MANLMTADVQEGLAQHRLAALKGPLFKERSA